MIISQLEHIILDVLFEVVDVSLDVMQVLGHSLNVLDDLFILLAQLMFSSEDRFLALRHYEQEIEVP